jgi:tape measure domain-containing protein
MRVATLSALVTVEGASQAGADLDGFSKKLTGVTGAADKMATALGIAGAAAGAYAMGRSALDAAAKMESLQQALKANTSGTAELQQVTRDLANIAKLPAINLEESYRGFIQLRSAKFSIQEAENALKALAKATAATGGGPAEFAGGLRQIQQMASKPFALFEDIDALNTNLPNTIMLLERAFGTARTEDLKKMGLTGRDVAMGLIAAANQLPVVTGGIANMLVNLEDSTRALMVSIGTLISKFLDAFGPRIQEAVGKLTDFFEKLSQNGQKVDQIMRIAFTFMVGSVVAGAIKNIAIMTEAFVTLRKAIQSVALAEVLAFAIANPGKAIAGVVAAVGIITAANIGINKMLTAGSGAASRRRRTDIAVDTGRGRRRWRWRWPIPRRRVDPNPRRPRRRAGVDAGAPRRKQVGGHPRQDRGQHQDHRGCIATSPANARRWSDRSLRRNRGRNVGTGQSAVRRFLGLGIDTGRNRPRA